MKIRITGDGIESNDAELLAESLDTLRDSLEDLRLTAISMCDTRATIQETDGRSQMTQQRYPLDSTIRVCGQMANLQLLAAMPTIPGGLFPWEPMLEFDTTHNSFRDDLLNEPLNIQAQVSANSGFVNIPGGPGLGVTPNRDFIEKFNICN